MSQGKLCLILMYTLQLGQFYLDPPPYCCSLFNAPPPFNDYKIGDPPPIFSSPPPPVLYDPSLIQTIIYIYCNYNHERIRIVTFMTFNASSSEVSLSCLHTLEQCQKCLIMWCAQSLTLLIAFGLPN